MLCTRRYFLLLCRGRGGGRSRKSVALQLSTTGGSDAAAPVSILARLAYCLCRTPPLRLLLLLLLGGVHPAWDIYQACSTHPNGTRYAYHGCSHAH